METHEIFAEIIRNKSGLTEIGDSLDPKVTPQAVWRVVRGKSVSRRIRARVAQVIKLEVIDIWPQKEAV